MAQVAYANAEYTGGGIYQYHGKLENGNYFLCFTDWEDCLMEVDTDPQADMDNCGYDSWQQAHIVKVHGPMESRLILLQAIGWILGHAPEGNYSSSDMLEYGNRLLNELADIDVTSEK